METCLWTFFWFSLAFSMTAMSVKDFAPGSLGGKGVLRLIAIFGFASAAPCFASAATVYPGGDTSAGDSSAAVAASGAAIPGAAPASPIGWNTCGFFPAS